MRRTVSAGPGITGVTFATSDGDITVTRPDGRTATLAWPGRPDRMVALHRRDIAELLAEELRRLDPDEVYAETLQPARRPPRRHRRRRASGRMTAPEILVHRDGPLLAKAAAARTVTRLVDAVAAAGTRAPGADRRRYRHRGAR